MGIESKHGKYEKFDLNKARWECPQCGKDALVVESRAFRSPTQFSLTHSFKCEKCEFDSLKYGFQMKHKESFNSAHRKLTDMWFNLLVAEKKGWEVGFDTAMKVAASMNKGCCDEDCQC
jgi:predicted RNA-binding Zn-ribbon protein involved in translation (DUF1610 family)